MTRKPASDVVYQLRLEPVAILDDMPIERRLQRLETVLLRVWGLRVIEVVRDDGKSKATLEIDTATSFWRTP